MGGIMGKTRSRLRVSIRSDAACRLIVNLHDESGNLVAHCLVPDKFIIVSRIHNRGVVPLEKLKPAIQEQPFPGTGNGTEEPERTWVRAKL
jgi:hypothetical protein